MSRFYLDDTKPRRKAPNGTFIKNGRKMYKGAIRNNYGNSYQEMVDDKGHPLDINYYDNDGRAHYINRDTGETYASYDTNQNAVVVRPSNYSSNFNNGIKQIDNVINFPLYFYDYLKKPNSGLIDLSNKQVAQITNNTDNIESILTNDFVENNNNNYRPKKDFVNTNDTLIGDSKIPLSNFKIFYGIENGKLRAGNINQFDDNTVIVPNRYKNVNRLTKLLINTDENFRNKFNQYINIQDSLATAYIKRNNIKPSLIDRILGISPRGVVRKYNPDYYNKYINKPANEFGINFNNTGIQGITENGDTINLPPLNSPKMLFSNEKGDGIFVSDYVTELNNINKYLKKHPSYPIMVDNGRFSNYQTTAPNLRRYVGISNPNSMYILGTIRKRNGGSININPANRGKFTATMKRTCKSAEELSHSSNPLTRKRAIFALNARKWNH